MGCPKWGLSCSIVCTLLRPRDFDSVPGTVSGAGRGLPTTKGRDTVAPTEVDSVPGKISGGGGEPPWSGAVAPTEGPPGGPTGMSTSGVRLGFSGGSGLREGA